VLLIEDEEPIRKLLRTILQLEGFSVETKGSAKGGIEALSAQPYDAVITDLKMETDTAGFEVVKKATNLQPKPVTIVLTAFPIPTSVWKKAGADALLTKGGESLKLVDRLRALIMGRKSLALSFQT
jgi:DNA-binding response OmpR family regulator